MPSYVADRRLYVTADRSEVVEHGDPRAAFLLAGEGREVGPAEVERYDLAWEDGGIVYPDMDDESEAKAAPEPENKMALEPENKAAETEEWTLATPPDEYLERYPDGPNADLARRIVNADA